MSEPRGVIFWLAVLWLALLSAGVAGAGWLPMASPEQIDWVCLAVKPGAPGHLLGTDGMGRDILSRVLFGGRTSLVVGVGAASLGVILGCLLGVPAGFFGGYADRLIMWITDVFLAFPRLVFLLMVMFVFGSNLGSLTFALGFVCAPSFARLARANSVKVMPSDFILAARAAGAGNGFIILREILPNIISPLLVYMILVTGSVIIAEGSLGFLGLSVPSPTPTWGGMIAAGREVLDDAPHVSLIPTAVMFLTILAINVVAESVRAGVSGKERP